MGILNCGASDSAPDKKFENELSCCQLLLIGFFDIFYEIVFLSIVKSSMIVGLDDSAIAIRLCN